MNYYYLALLAACCFYAFMAGGRPERIGAAVLAIGSVLTIIVMSAPPLRFRSVELAVVVVDILCLILYVAMALRADRFWPIWATALVGVGALGHLGKWFSGPDMDRWAYAFSIAIWSYPILALLAIGTFNHQRRNARLRVSAPRARA